MRWFVKVKGSETGQEFKWYLVNSEGDLNCQNPECDLVKQLENQKGSSVLVDTNNLSIALVREQSSRLTLLVTKLLSAKQIDFADRISYAHLVAESESASDDDKLQLLAADLLDSTKIIEIDDFIRPSGETKEEGAVVDRTKLNNAIRHNWAILLQQEIVPSKLDEYKIKLKDAINKIVFEPPVKLAPPLRDKTLFDNQLDQRLNFFCELLNPKSDYGDNRRDQFIIAIDHLVNFLEIGFVVDWKKLNALSESSKSLILNDELPDRKIAKISDIRKKELAVELSTFSLPQSKGALIVVTHNVDVAKFEMMPSVYRVLSANETSESWVPLNINQENTTRSGNKKNHYDKLKSLVKPGVKLAGGAALITTEFIGGALTLGGSTVVTGGAAGIAGGGIVGSAIDDIAKIFSDKSTQEQPPES